MLKKFNEIKERYDKYRDSFLKQGKLPIRSTAKGFWGYSICEEVFEIFNRINLQDYSHFLDLGSGDGRVVMIASLFTKATGVEADRTLVKKSRQISQELSSSAEFIHGDFFDHELSKYDILYSFPDTSLHFGLKDKLEKELNGKLILVGPQIFPVPLKKHEEFFINGTKIGIYSKSNYSKEVNKLNK